MQNSASPPNDVLEEPSHHFSIKKKNVIKHQKDPFFFKIVRVSSVKKAKSNDFDHNRHLITVSNTIILTIQLKTPSFSKNYEKPTKIQRRKNL